ncbi:25-hydroxyvitamin D-1 alpha hydroxylase, mitochondrial [Melopsittacus undulatus]|uniref:25-hydroxyvitamin D-1 alpha hydroxylase, mitochondrial n=1 Tax=Melopsittacus undulatus TaxID=13146 RepID=UPI00146A80FE|nr:25-hydroxyvitamin D-1 alpha hydroxylase, mitochondrial [Melopsittacus undulatus]
MSPAPHLPHMFLRFLPPLRPPPRAPSAPRGMAEMPGPSPIASMYQLLCRGGLSRMHEMQVQGRARYGPLWKAAFGPIETVHVAQAELIQQVLRQEGTFPVRSQLSSWKEYREWRGRACGLLTAEGAEWLRLRRLLGRLLLHPYRASSFSGAVGSVVAELVLALQREGDGNPEHLVRDLSSHLYRFGLEASSAVLFASRLGCLEPEVPSAPSVFIGCVHSMFRTTLLTMALPRLLLRMRHSPWDTFCRAWDGLFEFAQQHIDHRVAAVVAQPHSVHGVCVTDLLLQEGMSMESIYGNVTELLLAGVDTISSTLTWSLYELARNPQVQAALYRELTSTSTNNTSTGTGNNTNTSTGNNTNTSTGTGTGTVPLLRAVVKETLRLYPVIPANARVIPDRDIRVGEFLVPRKTLITLCHYAASRDPRVFPAPDQFHPERWLYQHHSVHPFASLPFGVGKRSCVGRRIAELQVYQALAQILLRFEVRPEPGGGPILPMTRTLLVPSAPVNLQFLPR